MQGLDLLLQHLIFRFQLGFLSAPRMDGDFLVYPLIFQLALSHVKCPQHVLMLCLVFLTRFLKADGFQLVGNGFALLVVVRHAEQLVQFLDAGLFPGCRFFQRVNLFLHRVQQRVQILGGAELLGFQITDGFRKLFQVSDFSLAAVCAPVTVVIVSGQ